MTHQKRKKSEAEMKCIRLMKEAEACELDGRLIKAISLYRSAIEYWPGNAQAHYKLGIALATNNESQQAIRALKRALWIDPSLRNELANALDIEDELRDTEIVNITFTQDSAKKAA